MTPPDLFEIAYIALAFLAALLIGLRWGKARAKPKIEAIERGLGDKIKSLELAVGRAESEGREQRGRIGELEAELEAQTSRAAAMESELRAKAAEAAQIQARLKQAGEELAGHQQAVAAAESEMARYRAELARTRELFAEAKAETAKLAAAKPKRRPARKKPAADGEKASK